MSTSRQNSAKASIEEDSDLSSEDERLRGDAIGDTLYSESWVLRTLVKLTQELHSYSKKVTNSDIQENNVIELGESLEAELCFLWDMSADKEVADCLFQHDILSLTKCVVEESIAPRLTEIGIGILANISCQQRIGHEIILDSELMNIVVSLMSNEDSKTIIQIVQLLENLIHYFKEELCTMLLTDQAFWISLAFILENSVNEELLIKSIKLLDNLTSHMAHDEEIPYQSILSGMIEAQKQLQSGNSDVMFNYREEVQDSFDALVSALYNFSRNKHVRLEIVNARYHVCSFLAFYFSHLLKSICESMEEKLAILTTSAVQAATLFFVTITSERQDCKILELMGHIGSKLEPCLNGKSEASKYASDYLEIVGDCFRKQLDLGSINDFLGLLESLDAKALAFMLQAADRTVPDRLPQLVDSARSGGSFNKVIETYESLGRNDVR